MKVSRAKSGRPLNSNGFIASTKWMAGETMHERGTMKNLSLSVKVVIVLLAAFSIFAGVYYWTLNELKVNGVIYFEVIKNKDLVADILPPPEYIIESYLVVQQMVNEQAPEKLKLLQSEGDRLRKEYEERHAYWGEESSCRTGEGPSLKSIL